MDAQFDRLRYMNVNARFTPKVVIEEKPAGFATINVAASGMTIRYTTDGSIPNEESLIYKAAIELKKPTVVKARAFHPSGMASLIKTEFFHFPEFSIESNIKPIRGTKLADFFDGVETTFIWSHPLKKDDYITIKFEEPLKLGTIEVLTGDTRNRDFLQHAILEVSYDGINFEKVAQLENGVAKANVTTPFKAIKVKVTDTQKGWVIMREIKFK